MKYFLIIICFCTIFLSACTKSSNETPEEQIRKYTAQVEKNPNNGKAYILRARVYNQNEKTRKLAFQDAQRALSLPLEDKDKGSALLEKVRSVFYEESRDVLLQDAKEAVRLNPNLSEGYKFLGIIYSGQKDYRSALDSFNRALDLRKTGQTFLARGVTYWELGNISEALSDINLAIKYAVKYNQDTHDLYYLRGSLLAEKNQHQQAISDFDKVLSMQEDYDEYSAYLERGYSYIALRNKSQGIKDIKTYLEKASIDRSYPAYKQLIRIYILDNNFKECISTASELLTKKADDEVFFQRGKCYLVSGDISSAEKDFRSASKINPVKESYKEEIARIKRMKLGIKPKIQEKFEKIIKSYTEQYSAAETELQKGHTRVERKKTIARSKIGPKVQGWVGTIKDIGATQDGRASLEISINSNLSLTTWNNSFSDYMDDTLIPNGSALYKKLLPMKKGQKVNFSGYFIKDYYSPDFYKEGSLSSHGSMTEPEFLFRFTAIERAD